MEADLRYRNAGNASLLSLIDRRELPSSRALDLGCGTGANARLLALRGWEVTGVTHDPAELAACAGSCHRVQQADLAAGLPFAADGSYDLVLLSHVLEHLVDPAALLQEVRRVLTPRGRAAVALPNVLYYRQRAQFLRGRFDYTDTGVLDTTHLRFFTVRSGARLLTDNGYEILSAGGVGNVPLPGMRSMLPARVAGRLDAAATTRFPDLFGWQGIYLARPATSSPTAAGAARRGVPVREAASPRVRPRSRGPRATCR